MELNQIQIPPTSTSVKHKKTTKIDSFSENLPSNALLLLLYLTNAVFFAAVYFLLVSWRDKIRHSKPLHVLTLSETVALLAFTASFVYLLGFFGFGSISIQPVQEQEHEEEEEKKQIVLKKKENDVPEDHFTPLIKSNPIISSEEDEEIVKGVVEGRIPSYSLESKLGDCKRAAAIRREAMERITGKSLDGLPLENFNYESILGQCCEMPVGYVQIPVGIAGPLLLDGEEYSVPMATMEGCLVASTNRGCKAIYACGGANSVVLKDGMTRAPVVRFATAKRAAQLKLYLEDP